MGNGGHSYHNPRHRSAEYSSVLSIRRDRCAWTIFRQRLSVGWLLRDRLRCIGYIPDGNSHAHRTFRAASVSSGRWRGGALRWDMPTHRVGKLYNVGQSRVRSRLRAEQSVWHVWVPSCPRWNNRCGTFGYLLVLDDCQSAVYLLLLRMDCRCNGKHGCGR